MGFSGLGRIHEHPREIPPVPSAIVVLIEVHSAPVGHAAALEAPCGIQGTIWTKTPDVLTGGLRASTAVLNVLHLTTARASEDPDGVGQSFIVFVDVDAPQTIYLPDVRLGQAAEFTDSSPSDNPQG